MNIAIIGGSGHFEYALQGLSNNEEDQLVAFAPGSSDEDTSAIVRQLEPSGVSVYDEYVKMLDEAKPEVAVINPHYYLNGKITLDCMKRGIHCFVEKPLSFSLTELEEIISLFNTADIHLTSMMYLRYHNAFYAACKAVEEGMIGEALLITAQKSYKMGTKPEWMHKKNKFGGIISWVGSHAIDLIHWITRGEIVEVFAHNTTAGNKGFGEVESSAICLYRLANGGQATVNIDYFRPDKAPTHGDDRLRVAGEKGVIEVMNDKAISITHDQGPAELPLEDEVSMFGDFLNQIKTGNPCRIPAEDVFQVTRLCILSQEAADTQKAVKT